MSLPTHTLLGSIVPAVRCDFSTNSSVAASPSVARVVNTSNIWPGIDYAFSPVYEAPDRSGCFYVDLGEVRSFNAIFLAHPSAGINWTGSTPIKIASAATDAYTSTGAATCIAGYAYYQYPSGWYAWEGRQIFYFDQPQTARYIALPFTVSASTNLLLEEIACANLVELQYNEELVSFTRTPGTVNSQSLTLQNGRSIQIVTGKATDRITASYKWSDDGTIAQQLYDIFTETATNGTPILWVPPITDTSTDSVRYRTPEILMLESIPEIKQSAATIWEMQLAGRCQP